MHRERIKQGCLEKRGSAIRYMGLCGVKFYHGIVFELLMSFVAGVLFCMRADFIKLGTEFKSGFIIYYLNFLVKSHSNLL